MLLCCCCCCHACKDHSLNSSSHFGSLQSFSSSSPPATFGILFVVTRPQLKIWRNVNASATGEHNFISLAMADAKAVRRKLTKQLKIALELHEKVRIFKEPVNHSELVGEQPETYMLNMLKDLGDHSDAPCTTQISTWETTLRSFRSKAATAFPSKKKY